MVESGRGFGERMTIVTADDWTGPAYQTCRNAGTVAKRFDVSHRADKLTFKHHEVVAALPEEQARSLLAWAAEPGQPHSTRELAARVKQIRRDDREREMGVATLAASQMMPCWC
jgi:hypothetical protein